MKTGANLKLSNTTLANSRMILDQLEACGFTSITLLRYKPPPDIDQWKQEHPALSALLEFEPILAGRVAGSPHLSIRVDCALAFVLVKSDSTATGRKKADTYSYQYHDQVAEIQDSIGYTTAGFPYMTAEEISVWLEENDPTIKYQGYPLWLLQAGAVERGGEEGKL